MKMRSIAVLCSAFLFVLSGCGGGGGGSSSALPGTSIASAGNAPASFVITIPRASSTSARKPAYVSPNTASVVISLSSGALSLPASSPCTLSSGSVTCATTGTSSGCTTSSSTITCTFQVIAPVGSDQFNLQMLSSTGAQLSTGSVTATVAASGTTVPITMNGIVDSVIVSLATTAPSTGATATIPVTVTAKDPSGATIVGPGNYNVPITLTDSDTSGATTLSTTTVTAPGATVTLTYNGSSTLTSAVISATVSGISTSKITSATLSPASTIKAIASGSGALAIYTNSAGQTYAYLPSPSGLTAVLVSSGSKLGSGTGRRPLASGSGTITLTPTPDACATDPVHVRLYCVAYASNVVNVLDLTTIPATVTATYTTDASASLSFTGGSCEICGAAYDAADNGIVIATANGYELYSAPPGNALVKTIAAPVSENFGYNAVTNQVWSPHYPGSGTTTTFDLADIKAGKLYTLSPTPTGLDEPDQGAVDNQTNIGLTTQEFANVAYLLPFSLATLDAPSAGMFTDPVGQVTLTSSLSSSCDTMLDDIAIDSQAHLAFFTGEFCSPGPIGVAQMPSASGASPTISDWNFVNVPNQPNGLGWNEAHDPHAVAAFNIPPICTDCGAIFNLDRSYLAVVDLKKLLAAPRDTTDSHLVANTYDLICNGVVTFLATDATKNGNSGCATTSQAINNAGGTFTASAAGFTASGGYNSNTASGGTLSLTLSTEAPPNVNYGGTTPSGTPIAFTTITPSVDVPFTGTSGLGFASLAVPSWVPTGKTYGAYFYDSTSGAFCGNATGTLSGSTITFTSGSSGSTTPGTSCTNGGNHTLVANHVVVAVVTYQ